MKLEILGCSGGIGKGLKTTSFLLEKSLLIDAGTGLELLEMEDMLAIRNVLITHAHVDHIVGLPLMLASIYDQHQEPVNVYAIPEVIEALEEHIFNWTVWPDFTKLPDARPILNLNTIQVGDEFTLENKTVTVIPAVHPTPTAGYLITDGVTSMAFTGDSGMNPDLWPILNERKPELLIIDVSFTDDVGQLAIDSGHLTPSQLASELTHLDPDNKPMIRLTHLKPGFEEEIYNECKRAVNGFDLQRLHHNQVIEF